MASSPTRQQIGGLVPAPADLPRLSAGQHVRIDDRVPVGHYRVPTYLRGKEAVIEAVMSPKAVNNEEEGFGRNAGSLGFYYRVAVPMTELWKQYAGQPGDNLRIEVFETWLKGMSR
ncbi:nitrile hydratase subunit beta [Mesorhizobium sp. M2E.F.Ca.ET.209.01.1.1]|uniref:SH3-like domain-containing protein n=1 Tax=Mesorhizobium sp. M2E.F.Ca.ET.209.01.1.1 TaxID=2500526 RepID=UPI000FDC95F1|nr:SH3-like domain-containing protein [Mesorhizobium sp. M2E.F.Ca.ET.209.01.1.1]TGS17294.1 nitrile hydratase subunit beta [Mesorhizobium sp. M2E.F.Ca.ET.209.01.1.1]